MNSPLFLGITLKREKTKLQKYARRELYRLTDEELHPDWFRDPEKVKRKDALLKILEPELTEDELMAAYFAKRPGMKEKVLLLMAKGATNSEIHEVIGVGTSKPYAYLRKKYGFVSRSKGLGTPEGSPNNFGE